MSTIHQAQLAMERDATLVEAWLFESSRNHDKDMQIVAIEQARQPQLPANPAFEYFRARASMPGNPKSHFDVTGNAISVTVCHASKSVLFGPLNMIQMYPEGHGLGPALMARVIDWLHRSGLHKYDIVPGKLSGSTVHTIEERVRRNSFYTNFGFTLSGRNAANQRVTGGDVLDGSFHAASVGSLEVEQKYLERLVRCSDFYGALRSERLTAARVASEIKTIETWAKGRGWGAIMKRVMMYLMGSPINRR